MVSPSAKAGASIDAFAKRKHHHRAVVGPQNLGLAHIPRQRSHGRDRDAAWSTRREADGVAVRILDGVGVVAQIEERGIEPGLRLRSGLHAEITEGMTSVQLRLSRDGEKQRQPERSGQQRQSFHLTDLQFDAAQWQIIGAPE